MKGYSPQIYWRLPTRFFASCFVSAQASSPNEAKPPFCSIGREAKAFRPLKTRRIYHVNGDTALGSPLYAQMLKRGPCCA